MYDVIVIGGGVTGCAAARALSRYACSVALVDAASDVAMGASRANSAIVHAGYDAVPGTWMAKMNVRGNQLYDSWCRELEVPLGRCGSLVLAFSEKDMQTVRKLYQRGLENGVPGMQVLDAAQTHEKQQGLSDQVVGALWAATGAITCPYEMTIACAENAAANGVEFFLNWPVASIRKTDGGLEVSNQRGDVLQARFVVNAAGLFADDIARMVGDESFSIHARKGEYMLLDKKAAKGIDTVIFQTPSELGKGILVSPTVDGNAFAGPTAREQESKTDTSVEQRGIDELHTFALKSMPGLNLRQVITAFAGLRAQPSTGDFILGFSEAEPKMLHLAGICSPGLTSAPAIAEFCAAQLRNAGLTLKEKPEYQPNRKHIRAFRLMSEQEKAEAVRENPLYSHVICRCETITEAEIVEAIRRTPGATTLDGVKRRTRAGMGRCQGGFCSPRVMDILSRELHVPMEELTKFGGGSKLLAGRLEEE